MKLINVERVFWAEKSCLKCILNTYLLSSTCKDVSDLPEFGLGNDKKHIFRRKKESRYIQYSMYYSRETKLCWKFSVSNLKSHSLIDSFDLPLKKKLHKIKSFSFTGSSSLISLSGDPFILAWSHEPSVCLQHLFLYTNEKYWKYCIL